MGRMGRKRGFTLMELMVYIAVLGVVVIIAGQAFSNSTKFRVRTTNMIKAADVSERTAAMFLDDVGQTGVKSFKESGDNSNPDRLVTNSAVYINPPSDSSSFILTKRNDGDSLLVNRVRFNGAGAFQAVEQVRWYKRGKAVYRSCESIALGDGVTAPAECPDENPPEVMIAENVDTFEIIAARPGIIGDGFKDAAEMSVVLPETAPGSLVREFRLVPRYDMSYMGDGPEFVPIDFLPNEGGMSQVLSGFVSNYDTENHRPITDGKKAHQVYVAKAHTGVLVADGNYWSALCTKVTLDSAAEYEISFNVPYSEDNSRLFCPGRDHAAVGFRNLEGNAVEGLNDFLFYTPATEDEPARRSFRFSVKRPVREVCMAFTFSSYAPSTGGRVTINDLLLKKIESSHYNFKDPAYNPDAADKKNVKAFKLHLVVSHGGESSGISQVVPTPSNGPRD